MGHEDSSLSEMLGLLKLYRVTVLSFQEFLHKNSAQIRFHEKLIKTSSGLSHIEVLSCVISLAFAYRPQGGWCKLSLNINIYI